MHFLFTKGLSNVMTYKVVSIPFTQHLKGGELLVSDW